ncbi:ribosome maturation factor RimP [Leuconostoc citreum]|uniref:ribosome maturation factor RimP n=1 Tax=Leuconostoc citreum TaxID=33964 RepID=UPI000BFF109F|nr:ribosome maturation factor RimP [Leuconostoc citreum]
MANKVAQEISTLIEPLINAQQLLLWDVSYTKEGGQKVLRILIDKRNHEFITMDDITTFTQAVNELLDTIEPDPIPEAYMLDISSPGADRPLIRPWHYEWAKASGENILVAFFVAKNGQKKWQGKIETIDDKGITLTRSSETIVCTFDEIAKAVLDTQF